MGTMSTMTDLSSVSLTYCRQPEVPLNTGKKFNMETKMNEDIKIKRYQHLRPTIN